MKDRDNIKFVARHYRADAFSRKDVWNAMGLGKIRRLRRLKVAAAVAGIVAFTAAAAIFVRYEMRHDNAENTGLPSAEESSVQQQFVTVLILTMPHCQRCSNASGRSTGRKWRM
ncbi:MAG: hypothetical protein K2H03_09565, partial [Muribaculaceae bacterium]|nr:hypothetical protein [Muribaculaceae bacterium]